MAYEKKVYKNPSRKNSFISIVVSGCNTPFLPVKFCNLVKPFYYPNSPTIPRYSISAAFDPKLQDAFLKSIQTIEQNEGVESILKPEIYREGNHSLETGKLLVKFQTKTKIPVFMIPEGKTEEEAEDVVLEDELARGEIVQIRYDVLRYTKKDSDPPQYGLSFKPTRVYWFPHLSTEKQEGENGDS